MRDWLSTCVVLGLVLFLLRGLQGMPSLGLGFAFATLAVASVFAALAGIDAVRQRDSEWVERLRPLPADRPVAPDARAHT
ncbi:MAG: hypothetical protein R3362_12230 [Rhodothermales bacterium]|nr:hypothetical protein [Rhodothermales bacterium]